MATVNLNDLRIKNAKNFIASLNTDAEPSAAEAYIFIGRPDVWPTGDNNPPTPTNNFREFYNTYDQMLSLKRVRDTDAYHMLPRYKWQSGTTYDIYNPNYSSQSKSFTGQTNLYDCKFVVENTNHSVYVCLFNNSNVASTVEPQDAGDEPFITSDGYQWLRVYDIPASNIEDHTTDNYIPIIQNNVVVSVDARITSMVILLLFYLIYLLSWRIFDNNDKAIKITSTIAIFGVINVPIIKFSVDWWTTLHQPSSINILSKTSIHSSMLIPLAIMTAAFALFSLLIFLMKYNTELIKIKNKGLDRL